MALLLIRGWAKYGQQAEFSSPIDFYPAQSGTIGGDTVWQALDKLCSGPCLCWLVARVLVSGMGGNCGSSLCWCHRGHWVEAACLPTCLALQGSLGNSLALPKPMELDSISQAPRDARWKQPPPSGTMQHQQRRGPKSGSAGPAVWCQMDGAASAQHPAWHLGDAFQPFRPWVSCAWSWPLLEDGA